ncbi:hypothetical protein ACVWXM_008491 [Bradyrhizobium sp. GM7.3]
MVTARGSHPRRLGYLLRRGLVFRRGFVFCRSLGWLFGSCLHRLLGDDLLLRCLLCRLRGALLPGFFGGRLFGLRGFRDVLGSFARARVHGLLRGFLDGLGGSLLLAALAFSDFLSSRCHDEFLYRLLEIGKRTCVSLLS